jgi:hypothetical protein
MQEKFFKFTHALKRGLVLALVIKQLEQYTGNQYDLLPNGYIAKTYICLKFVQLPDF